MAGHRSGSGTGGWSGHADRTTTTLTELEAAVACSAAYRTAAGGAAPVAMSTVAAAILAVSRLVAGVREVTGHPSGPQIAADTGMTVDTSRHACRTAVVPEAVVGMLTAEAQFRRVKGYQDSLRSPPRSSGRPPRTRPPRPRCHRLTV
jgi:hypothetical protein